EAWGLLRTPSGFRVCRLARPGHKLAKDTGADVYVTAHIGRRAAVEIGIVVRPDRGARGCVVVGAAGQRGKQNDGQRPDSHESTPARWPHPGDSIADRCDGAFPITHRKPVRRSVDPGDDALGESCVVIVEVMTAIRHDDFGPAVRQLAAYAV